MYLHNLNFLSKGNVEYSIHLHIAYKYTASAAENQNENQFPSLPNGT